jgi:DNA repair exonuclease SbcCD ATPase subunit
MEWSPETLPDDPAALKAMIIAQQAETSRLQASVRAYEVLIQALKLRIAKLQRQKFGPSSEKIRREIEQLELTLEDLEVAMAAAVASDNADERDEAEAPSVEKAEPRRRGKPRVDAATPRERIVLDPGDHCPQCGEPLRLLGEDISEILDFIAAKLKVGGDRASQEILPVLRENRANARSDAPNLPRHVRPESDRPYPRLQVRRSFALV